MKQMIKTLGLTEAQGFHIYSLWSLGFGFQDYMAQVKAKKVKRLITHEQFVAGVFYLDVLTERFKPMAEY